MDTTAATLTIVATGLGIVLAIIGALWKFTREIGGIAATVDSIRERFGAHVEDEKRTNAEWREIMSSRVDWHDRRITDVERALVNSAGGGNNARST